MDNTHQRQDNHDRLHRHKEAKQQGNLRGGVCLNLTENGKYHRYWGYWMNRGTLVGDRVWKVPGGISCREERGREDYKREL